MVWSYLETLLGIDYIVNNYKWGKGEDGVQTLQRNLFCILSRSLWTLFISLLLGFASSSSPLMRFFFPHCVLTVVHYIEWFSYNKNVLLLQKKNKFNDQFYRFKTIWAFIYKCSHYRNFIKIHIKNVSSPRFYTPQHFKHTYLQKSAFFSVHNNCTFL